MDKDDIHELSPSLGIHFLVCIVQSSFIKFGCVLLPSFLLLFGFILFTLLQGRPNWTLFICASLPLFIYVFAWCCLASVISTRQNVQDNRNSWVAQKYVKRLEEATTTDIETGQVRLPVFNMFITAAKDNDREKIVWCLSQGQHPDEGDAVC